MADETSHVVLALANLMEANGRLNGETTARLDLAVDVFFKTDADWLMLIGWDYRSDSDIAICDAMAAYVLSETEINEDMIILNRASRDTAGDAILSRIQLEQRFSDFRLSVVTTDYHIARVKAIFSQVYGPRREISFYGHCSDLVELKRFSEKSSHAAFMHTFKGIRSGELQKFRDRLLASHPFYNGTCFPDRHVPEAALIIESVVVN